MLQRLPPAQQWQQAAAAPPLKAHIPRAGQPQEVRPTSSIWRQVAVGRTSFDGLGLETRPPDSIATAFSATSLGRSPRDATLLTIVPEIRPGESYKRARL